jgi:Co/Zn/Cd efflux system component
MFSSQILCLFTCFFVESLPTTTNNHLQHKPQQQQQQKMEREIAQTEEQKKKNIKWWWLSGVTRVFIHTLSVDRSARRIMIMNTILFLVACIEMHYAYHSEYLALLATAYYTLFDVMALTISLVAHIVSKQRSSLIYSYGYDRVEVLLGFAVGTYLIFVSLYVFFEAFERLLEPPPLHSYITISFLYISISTH